MELKRYLSESWPYSYDITDYEIIKPIEKIKEERTADSIIVSYVAGVLSRYFDPKGIQDIQEKRRIIEEEYKQKLKDLILYMEEEYPSKAIEGRKKLETLIPIYGKRIVAHMILHSELSFMDFEEVVKYLPSKELLEKDLDHYELLERYTCGYSSKIDYPLSLKLIMDLVQGKSLEEYPEQLVYIHQICTGHGVEMTETAATFTKSEILSSIEDKQKSIKKKIRK